MDLLAGQVALITGGGRGLGRSMAMALASEGAAVVIDDIFVDEHGVSAAASTAEAIRSKGGRSLALNEDVTSEEGASSMVAQVVEEFGRVDILVNCAGNVVRGPISEITVGQWDSVMNLHLKGHFLSAKAVLPHMLEQDYGRIITIGSRSAFYQAPANKQAPKNVRGPASVAYSAAKAGILGFTTTLAYETWDTGVTANCLLPSATTQLFPEGKARMVGGVPASQSLDPDDIAPTVVYLSSPRGADVSGRIFYASGGDILVYGNQLDVNGSRMVRKHGRWTQEELANMLPALVDLPNG